MPGHHRVEVSLGGPVLQQVQNDLRVLRVILVPGVVKRLACAGAAISARYSSAYLDRTPFKVGTEPAITLEKEIARAWRFGHEEDEKTLLDASDPHLRAVIVALLDTACRVGEILSLQWRNVSLERRELMIEAVKSKTRTARIVPVSTRLKAILEMRRTDPSGEEFGPDTFVFGNEVGQQVRSIRAAWAKALNTAGLTGLQLRDLRH